MNPPPSRRPRRAVLLLVAVLLVAWVGYVATAGYFLSTGRLKALVNRAPDRTAIEYESGSSFWPGRARVRKLRVRDRDGKAEWMFELEEARISFSVLGLLRRRLHVTRLTGAGSTFRARNRLTPAQAADAKRVALLPPIPGFPDPPRLLSGDKKPPPTGREWAIRVDDLVVVDMRELWVDAYRYTGVGRLTGAFFLQPKVHAQIFRAQLTTEGGTLKVGTDSLAEDVKATLRGKVEPWDPRDFPGSRMLRFLSGEGRATARLPDVDLVNRLLGTLAGTRLERGGGLLAIHGAVARGVARGSVDLSAPWVSLRILDVGFRGKLEARADVAGLDLLKQGASLTGGHVRLTDATVSGTGDGTRPWWLKATFLPGRLLPRRGVLLSGAVDLRARDGRPFLAIVKGRIPDWVAKRFDLQGLSGRAGVRLGDDVVEVERLAARAGDYRIYGEYRARGASRRGTFLVDTGLLSVGIGIDGGKGELDVLGPRRWFEKRTGWEAPKD
jgi:hypothetical protein